MCTTPRVLEKRFLAFVLVSCVVELCTCLVVLCFSSESGQAYTNMSFDAPFFCHQVMDERSDMDRGLEVGGGANGATPMVLWMIHQVRTSVYCPE